MDHDDQLKYLAVLYHLGGEDSDAVTSWAETEFATNPEPHPLAEHLFLPTTDARSILVAIAKKRFGFDPISPDGDQYVRQVMSQYLARFLKRDITPIELCRIVVDVDAQYGDGEFPPEHPIPSWVGELWNACDWCDETWTHDSAQFLVAESRRLLDELRT